MALQNGIANDTLGTYGIELTTCLCHQPEGMKKPHDGWGETTSVLAIKSRALAEVVLTSGSNSIPGGRGERMLKMTGCIGSNILHSVLVWDERQRIDERRKGSR